MTTQSNDNGSSFQAPSNIVVLKSHMPGGYNLSLVVVDLENNEVVILKYNFHPQMGEKHLNAMIRTGMIVDLKQQVKLTNK
jgi:hypothetical protein